MVSTFAAKDDVDAAKTNSKDNKKDFFMLSCLNIIYGLWMRNIATTMFIRFQR